MKGAKFEHFTNVSFVGKIYPCKSITTNYNDVGGKEMYLLVVENIKKKKK